MASGVGPGEHGESTGIWIIHVLSATPRQILGNAEGAVPSPDGSLIAYRHSAGTPAVSVIDANGENARPLLTAGSNETFGKLQWSPDGKQVAVLVRRVGDNSSAIVAVELSGGERTELTRQPNLRSFVWLPDGRLVFATQDLSKPGGAALHMLERGGRDTLLQIGSDMTVGDMSTTADGKRLVLVRSFQQSDVYAADMKGSAISEPVRVTLDDRDDRPSGWQLDGRTILFESNRNGTFDVFRQALQSPAAELVAGGPELQFGAQAAPDGKRILHWSQAEGSDRMRLMSIPTGGGSSTTLFEAPVGARFHCSAGANAWCALATITTGKIQVREFNPADGTLRESSLTFQGAPAAWALAANPPRLAVLAAGKLSVLTSSGAAWEIADSALPGKVTGLAFFKDSTELLVTTGSARENLVLLAGRSGVRRLGVSPRQLSSPVPSPDGKKLLLGVAISSSNAWLVENF